MIAKLGVRAVLIKRETTLLHVASSLPVYVCSFADYSMLFKASQCVVHHGGVATLMQVVAAGKPSLILPRTLDQFDQAARAKKLGIAEVLPFKKMSEIELLRGIARVLASPRGDRFEKLKSSLHDEQGVFIASTKVSQLLNKLDLKHDCLS